MTQPVAAHRSVASWSRPFGRVDGPALATWSLAAGLVLYLALHGGGYDIVVRSQVGVVLWWIVLVGAAWGVLPAGRLTGTARAAIILFAAFAVWSAIGATSSLSSERSLNELSRVAAYLGALLLALTLHRDRERALRHTVHAIGVAVVAVAALALASRLVPGSFPSAQTTAAFLPGTEARLGWPLNYWNALAALVAVGLPLLISIATTARTLRGGAAAAAAIPMLLLCGYLTFSRGGAIAGAVALLAFVVLAPERAPKLATMLVAGAGGAILIAGAVHRSAIERGLSTHQAKQQGIQLLIAVLLVGSGVALAQVGIGLAARHGRRPALLSVRRRSARLTIVGAIALALVVAVTAGAPTKLAKAWQDFKVAQPTSLNHDNLARFGNASGNGRYDFWRIGVDATGGHVLNGSGPGTYQLLWTPRAPYYSYVVNAHSLYIETLAEDGIVGLGLLIGVFALVIGAALRAVVRTRYQARARAAGAAGALIAFTVSAIADWVWQVPVLPIVFLLLAAAVLAPARRPQARVLARTPEQGNESARSRPALIVRVGLVIAGVVSLAVIGIPLATTSAVRHSQAAASAGNASVALVQARSAARLEPSAASPQLQLALVLEQQRDYAGALIAARRANLNEPANWSAWLTRSRLEAEAGHAQASVSAYRRARSLNPRSPLFR